MSGPHLGDFRVINLFHLSGSKTGPPSETTIQGAVSEDFCGTSFQRGVHSFRCFLVFLVENRFLKKGMVAIPFQIIWLWGLLVDVGTRL